MRATRDSSSVGLPVLVRVLYSRYRPCPALFFFLPPLAPGFLFRPLLVLVLVADKLSMHQLGNLMSTNLSPLHLIVGGAALKYFAAVCIRSEATRIAALITHVFCLLQDLATDAGRRTNNQMIYEYYYRCTRALSTGLGLIPHAPGTRCKTLSRKGTSARPSNVRTIR